MAIIIMCTSNSCPVKENCYRYEKNPIIIQPCFNYEYDCNEETGFVNFIKKEGESN